MRRAAALISGMLLLATPVAAQSAGEILDDLEFRRYYLETGVEATVDEMEGLVARYPSVYFVALASDLDAGADVLAEELLEALGAGTVVVLTPGEAGGVSFDYGDSDLDRAFGNLAETEGSSYAEDFAEFAAGLTGDAAAEPEESRSGFPVVPLLVGAGLVGLIGFGLYRSSSRQKSVMAARLEEARTEIRQQLDVIATQIVTLADDARVEKHEAALQHYRNASETYREAESRLAAATALSQLEDLSDDLDRARWQLEATTALIEGRSAPPEPIDEKPQPCFFDPTHGAGVEEAVLETSAGTRRVLVCRADAEKLRRGEAPQPRQIPVGTGAYPAPQVPRSSGGLGMDWLDVFSILVGGMGRGIPYDWRPAPPRRSSGRVGFPFPSGGRRMARGTAGRGSMARGRRGR